MMRELINWIGLFTSTKHGLEMLHKFQIMEMVKNCIDRQGFYDHLLILFLYSFDYSYNDENQIS